MYKIKINLETLSDIKNFVNIADTIPEEVCLIDNSGHKVSAKSLLGCMYSTEFDETYVISDSEAILDKFNEFVY
nr:MAG TPA: phosphocarrier protein HPr [Caudoviricetes sp.]